MPNLETLSRPTTLNLPHLEAVRIPDVGGSFNPNLSLANTIVLAEASGRNLPSPEPQETNNFDDIDTQGYMDAVCQRRREFYGALGLLDQLNVVRNYDIPLARVMWERMKSERQKRMFIEYETDQVLAALGERYGVVELTPRYIIDSQRKLRFAPMPVEPIEESDKRAIEHYQNLNSPDAIREQSGHIGRLKIQEILSDPDVQVGKTLVQVSGPGLAEGSIQKHNFIWKFELKQHPASGQRFVEVAPLTSTADYPTYERNIAKISPEYFENKKGPMDLHLLENPIDMTGVSSEQVLKVLTGEVRECKPNEKFEQFKGLNIPRVKYFLEAVCAAIFDPHEAAERWQAVVAGGDIVWKQLQEIKGVAVKSVTAVLRAIPKFENMAMEVAFLAKQKIDNLLAPCGLSGGLNLKRLINGVKLSLSAVMGMATSVVSLAKDRMGGLFYSCSNPDCKGINMRALGGLDTNCGVCDSSDVACEPSKEVKKNK